jgi:hypothetical protein
VFALQQASDSGYGSETSLRKNASMLSLSSATSLTLSSTSSSSFKVEDHGSSVCHLNVALSGIAQLFQMNILLHNIAERPKSS